MNLKNIKWKNKILKLIWYSERGRSNVIGRVYGPTNEIMQILTFLGVYGIFLSNTEILGVIISVVVVSIFIGMAYVNMKLMKIETEFNNNQNPMLKRIEIKLDNQFKELKKEIRNQGK